MVGLNLNISTYCIRLQISRDEEKKKEKIRKRIEYELYMNEMLETRRALSYKYPSYYDYM